MSFEKYNPHSEWASERLIFHLNIFYQTILIFILNKKTKDKSAWKRLNTMVYLAVFVAGSSKHQGETM